MKYFNRKRILSLLLTGVLIVSCSPSVFALDGYNEVTIAGGVGNSELTLTVENTGGPVDPPIDPTDPPIDPPDPVLFSAYVPAELPIKMDLSGKITVPTNAMIINGVESKGIVVTDISVVLENGWTSASYEDDFATKADNTQEIALKLRDNTLQTDSTFPITADNWKIAKNSYIDLIMGVKIPKQTVAENKGKIATIGFTLDWSGDDVSTGPSVPVIPPIDPTPPVTEQFIVTYIADNNGSIMGNSSIIVNKDSTLTFPVVTANEGYIFDKWINSDTNEEVTTSTFVISNMSVKALFKVLEVQKVQVNFVADENGSLEGITSIEVVPGDTVSVFPTPKPMSIRYELDKWVNADSNEEITTTTPILNDITIKAVFSERIASPKNWFITDGKNTITGLSSEYLNLVDAPTDLVIPNNIGGSTITAIGINAFANKDLVTSIVIPKTVTTIGTNAFSGCTSLLELNLDFIAPYRIKEAPFGLPLEKLRWGAAEDWDTSPMSMSMATSMGVQFNVYDSTIQKSSDKNPPANLLIPSSIDGVKITKLYPMSFEGCKTIRNVTIPGTISTIAGNAFQNCTYLNTVTILGPVTTITGSSFSGCTALTDVVLSDSLITTIGTSVFEGCTKLKNVALPASLKSIGNRAFSNCTSLSNLDIPDSVIEITAGSLYKVPHVTYNGSATGAPWGALSIN